MSNLSIKAENLKKTQRPYISPYLKLLVQEQKGAKSMYNILNKNNDTPICKVRWQSKLLLTNLHWKIIFNNPFYITSDSSLQWFQVRIIHRLLGTNSFLHKIKYKDSPLCTFCNKEEETIEHLFWQCTITNSIIKSTLIFKTSPFNQLDLETLLFGYTSQTKKDAAKNTVLILTKMYIFLCKKNDTSITDTGLKKYLNFKVKILKHSELQKLSLCEFRNKWRPFNHIINLHEVLN
jgi:hypothetical protein